tara:strand:+ start:331 stop:741 length:411 start_codon:yes stop_codon:yes gene_type:complete
MPMYDYQCDRQHTTEHFFAVADKPFAVKCPKCRGEALQVILTCPSVHTIQTFHRDIDDPWVKKHADKDGYYDPNLGRDRKTGKRTKIKSERHREQLMREAGLQPYGETDVTKDADRLKRRKPLHFGAGGSRGSSSL